MLPGIRILGRTTGLQPWGAESAKLKQESFTVAASQDIVTSILVTFSFAVLIGIVVFRFFGKYLPVPRRLRVPPFQVGVFLLQEKSGETRPERTVPPGTYWVTPRRNILTCDTRPTSYKLAPEDFLTADNFGLRIGLTGKYRITGPADFLTASSNATGAFFLELTAAIRAATLELSGHNLTFARANLPTRLLQLIAPATAQYGITLELIEITDFVPLGWLKATLPQTPMPPTPQGYGPN